MADKSLSAGRANLDDKLWDHRWGDIGAGRNISGAKMPDFLHDVLGDGIPTHIIQEQLQEKNPNGR